MRATGFVIAILAISPTLSLAQEDTTTVGGRPVIGSISGIQAAFELSRIGDSTSAALVRRAALLQGPSVSFESLQLGNEKAYRYTSHVFGYIPPRDGPATGMVTIQNAENISADANLRNTSLKITLDRLRVYEYPGNGIHQILFDFYAQHQAAAGQEQALHFNQTYRVAQGQTAGIAGYPVFIGLRPGAEGVNFRVSTINVSNDDDRRLLGFLDSDVFRGGLKLVNGFNPVLPVVTDLAKGVTATFARRNENIPVQDFQMGLDFSSSSTRPKLREGSYIAVQIPDPARWNWADWVLNPGSGALVNKAHTTAGIPYNYIVFSVSKSQESGVAGATAAPGRP
jgi:hypothetical protein